MSLLHPDGYRPSWRGRDGGEFRLQRRGHGSPSADAEGAEGLVCRQTDRTCVFGGLLCRSVRCVFSGGIRIDLVFRPPRGSPSIDFSGARRSYKKGRAARAKFGFRRGPSDLVFLNSSKHSTQFLARRLTAAIRSLGADRLLVARAERNCTASQHL